MYFQVNIVSKLCFQVSIHTFIWKKTWNFIFHLWTARFRRRYNLGMVYVTDRNVIVYLKVSWLCHMLYCIFVKYPLAQPHPYDPIILVRLKMSQFNHLEHMFVLENRISPCSTRFWTSIRSILIKKSDNFWKFLKFFDTLG